MFGPLHSPHQTDSDALELQVRNSKIHVSIRKLAFDP
jgi:hypothetical protein